MTTLKCCFRMLPRPHRFALISRAAALALATAAFIASGAPLASAADTAPDWLRAAAQEKLPDYDKDTSAVILLDETQITVQDNGDIQTLHRQAIRLLRPEARREYGGIDVDFDKD